jgi:hypothetical protein
MNRENIEKITKVYNLKLESYKPGKIRLYAIYDYNYEKKISNYLTFEKLCSWLEGYEEGYEAAGTGR